MSLENFINHYHHIGCRIADMKTIKIDDEAYAALVRIAARLSLKDGEKHSFNDAVKALLENYEGAE